MVILLIWGVWAILSEWWDRRLLAALVAAMTGVFSVIIYSNRRPIVRWLYRWRFMSIPVVIGWLVAVRVLKP